MGCWGALCVFDRERYLAEVVPAFRAGERHPIIAFELERGRGRKGYDLGDMAGLADVMATFDDELATSSLGLGLDYRAPAGWYYEDLWRLFERVVTRHCISACMWIGREYRPAFTLSSEHGVVGADIESDALVMCLGERWRLWTHGSGGYAEGFQGWLDATETRAFAPAVRRLRPEPDAFEPHVHLARMQRIARTADHAIAAGRGLLWGGDLMCVYDVWERYDEGAHVVHKLPVDAP
jgi:hypothetical protein